jgi:predicted RNase H-like nuclease (RuvC/YqgF family)
LWDKCEKQKVELARAMADLAKSNETVTMLKVRNANLSRQVESYRKDAELTEHRLEEMDADGPMVPYDPNVRAYRYNLKRKPCRLNLK